MRCPTVLAGQRCQDEEGHDTGVGTPHSFAPPAPVSAEEAARELSQRLGVPCTAVFVDDGPVGGELGRVFRSLGGGETDGTPEGAALQLEAMWGALDETGPLAALAAEMLARRRRVRGAIAAYLAESERDWHGLFVASTSADVVGAIQDAKQLHDAQTAELLERIGGAL